MYKRERTPIATVQGSADLQIVSTSQNWKVGDYERDKGEPAKTKFLSKG